jgi:hypothetical protein
MVVVFLWLGNYTLWENRQSCGDSLQCDLDVSECIEYDWGFSCQPKTNISTIGDTSNTSTPCNISTSKLSWDVNAIVSAIWVSCKCKPNFGEYYDTIEGKTKCGDCSREDVCCGVKLNTRVPFIGDCIEDEKYTNDPTSVSQEEAFPVLMSSLTQMLVTIILIVSFVLIIIWGIQIATGNPSGGKKMIIKVVVAIAILWASGVILRLINPNFFG